MTTLSPGPGLERSLSTRSMKSAKPPGTVVKIKKKNGEVTDMMVGEDGTLQPLVIARSNSVATFSPTPVISGANSAHPSRPQTPLGGAALPPAAARVYKGAIPSPNIGSIASSPGAFSHPMLRQLSASSPAFTMPSPLQQPATPTTPRGPKAVPSPTVLTEILEKTPAEVGMSYRERFTRIYQKYAPEKMEKVENLLKHPAGCEAVLVELVKLYGPEPMVLVPTQVVFPPSAADNVSTRSQSPSTKTYKKIVKRPISRSNSVIPPPSHEQATARSASQSLTSPLLSSSVPIGLSKSPEVKFETKPKKEKNPKVTKAPMGSNAKAISDRLKNLRSSDSDSDTSAVSSEDDDDDADSNDHKPPTAVFSAASPPPISPSSQTKLAGSSTFVDGSPVMGKSALFSETQRPTAIGTRKIESPVDVPQLAVTPPSTTVSVSSRQVTVNEEIIPDRVLHSSQSVPSVNETRQPSTPISAPNDNDRPTATANTRVSAASSVAPSSSLHGLGTTDQLMKPSTLNNTRPPSIMGGSRRSSNSDLDSAVDRQAGSRTTLASSPIAANNKFGNSSTTKPPTIQEKEPIAKVNPRTSVQTPLRSSSVSSQDKRNEKSNTQSKAATFSDDKRSYLRNATPPRSSRVEPTFVPPPEPTPWPLRPYPDSNSQRTPSTHRQKTSDWTPMTRHGTPSRSGSVSRRVSHDGTQSPSRRVNPSIGPPITIIDRSTFTPNIGKPQPLKEIFGKKISEIKCPVRIGPMPTPKKRHRDDNGYSNDTDENERDTNNGDSPPRPGQHAKSLSPRRHNSPAAAKTLEAFEALKNMSYKGMKGEQIKEVTKVLHQTPKNSKYTYFDGLTADVFSSFNKRDQRPSAWAMAPVGNGNGALLAKIQKSLYKAKEEVEKSPPRNDEEREHHADPHDYASMTVADLISHSKRIIRTSRGYDNVAENADELDVLNEGGGGTKRSVGLDSKAGVDEIIFEKHLPHAYGQTDLTTKHAQTIVRADQGLVCVIREVPKDPEIIRQQKALSDRLSKPKHLFVSRDVVIPTGYN